MTAGLIPLFPLNIVLFPGGPLPLRIFETRYVDMVRNCMRASANFGVVLIRAGGEVGAACMGVSSGAAGALNRAPATPSAISRAARRIRRCS